MLEKNEVDIHSAPLDAVDQEYDAEAVDEEAFDASQANGRSKGSVNYT